MLTLKECYDCIGSYEEACWRLGNETRIRRYLDKFRKDGTFLALSEAMVREDGEQAFFHVHNLKGVYLNLAMTKAGETASQLCEALRGGKFPPEAPVLMEQLRQEHHQVLKSIGELLGESGGG